MSQRSKTTELLAEYFESKGGILNPVEYKKEQDTPIRLEQVKRVFGNWSRMEKIVRAFNARNENKATPTTDAREVVNEANRKAAEEEALIRSIGENVEEKTAREAAARAQLEADALNAKTPEGARENKVRKGGPESVDAKTIKESLARAVAEEHAMLAKTAEGSAEGKELLGGIEDQDAKALAIARQNERTERSALLAATPLGSALAMLEEDDSDGHLTREAQARIRNELRLYVDPAKEENIGDFVAREGEKLRPETRQLLERIQSDEDMTMGAAFRGERARDAVGAADISKSTDLSKAPPADQAVDDSVTGLSDQEVKDLGWEKIETAPEGQNEEPTDTQDGASGVASATTSTPAPKAEQNKDSVNVEENKANPETPPSDRNPDPKLSPAAQAEETVKKAAPAKPAASKAADKK